MAGERLLHVSGFEGNFMRHPLYLFYSLLILGLTGTAEYRGWTFTQARELREVPRSIRNNPGAFRSHYGGYSRYIGGK